MNRLTELCAGLLFGWGLLISGMTDPGKVIGFLDLAGAWDPSLAFVMGGAVMVGLLAFAVAKKRTRSVLGSPMHLPTVRNIDRRLVSGALIFGAGWGLAGFCPGPVIAVMGTGNGKAFLFVGAMIAGMLLFEVIDRQGRKTATQRANP